MPVLFEPHKLGDALVLKNRVVMAPMTRTRTSDGDVPNMLMATYYGQRASAGLLVTEATDISARSKGYARTPGIYTEAQVRGWQLVTDRSPSQRRHDLPAGLACRPNGAHIHDAERRSAMGRHGCPRNRVRCLCARRHRQTDLRAGKRAAAGRHRRNPPRCRGIHAAFRNAKGAEFDGIEIHGANGYLIDQFMNSALNTRTDAYGGESPQSRTRFALEVVDAAIRELGAGRVGLRVSPLGRYNSMPADPQMEETLLYLCGELSRRGVGYLHVLYQLMPTGNMEDSAFNQRHLSDDLVRKIRAAFKGTVIWCGGFDKGRAQAALDTGCTDLIAFGRPFIGNPDLVARLANDWPIVEADPSTYYTRNGEKGFTDFPNYDSRSGAV